MFSEIFYTFLTTTASGLLLALARMCYKSKCKTIKCCGMEIDRDTHAEEEEDLREMELKNTIQRKKSDDPLENIL